MARTLTDLNPAMLDQCMHCGMCLPACPTYQATRRERHSPRGRIALMRAVATGDLDAGGGFADEMDHCLGCLACQSACPAGVDYGILLEGARAEVDAQGRPPSISRSFWRALTLHFLFMRPRWLRIAGALLRLHQQLGTQTLLRRLGLTRLLPATLRRLEPQTPTVSRRFSHRLIAPREAGPGPVRHKVAMLTGCVQDLCFADINRDTVDVLLANGCEVHTPPLQPCCGSLHAHLGSLEAASTLARRMIDLIDPDAFDAIVTNAGGCGSHLRRYGDLLADDPHYADRARRWDTKLKDIHEWLVATGWRRPLQAPRDTPLTVTYHDSCHLAHGQKVTRQPRELLAGIPGVRLVQLPEADQCCGSAGVYSITRPDFANTLLQRKTACVISTGAEALATSNPGCHLHIERGLTQAGAEVELVQPVTLLAQAYRREHETPFRAMTSDVDKMET